MKGIENMRLYTHFGQINAPKSNDKVEINAGDYTIPAILLLVVKQLSFSANVSLIANNK